MDDFGLFEAEWQEFRRCISPDASAAAVRAFRACFYSGAVGALHKLGQFVTQETEGGATEKLQQMERELLEYGRTHIFTKE